jgi:uncharacterized protein involved in outer membrane biogenesis
MRRFWMCGVLFAGLLGLTGCDIEDIVEAGDGGRYSQDFHHSYPLKAGGRLSVENFNGSVEITGWDQDTVDISGTKYGPTPEIRDAIRIDIAAASDSVTIRTVRPMERRGNMGVRYILKVPRKVQLERIVSTNGGIRTVGVEGPARLRTSNGPVRVDGVRGSLEVQTSNGGVNVQNHDGSVSVHTSNGSVRAEGVRGGFEATTSNGGITAEVGNAEPGRTLRLSTSNGSIDLRLHDRNASDVRASTSNGPITLHLADKTNARLIANTSNSSIKTDFEVTAKGQLSKHHMEGVIGSGGPTLDLSTTNGSIRILRQ